MAQQSTSESAVMETAAAKFESVDESLQSMLSSLLNKLEALQTAWVGRGGTSFTQVKEAYAANQRKLSEALRGTATSIRSSGRNYSASDDQASGQVAAINTQVNLPL